MNGNRGQRVKHTKDSSGWDRLFINPEGHLGKNDGHNAWCIYLYHEVAHLPLQVEINRHYYIFTCWKTCILILLLLTVCKKNAPGNSFADLYISMGWKKTSKGVLQCRAETLACR